MVNNQIDNACLWYRQNREKISARLPIKTQGLTYTKRWPECFDAWVARYQSGDLPLNIADVYVLRTLRKIRDYLEPKK